MKTQDKSQVTDDIVQYLMVEIQDKIHVRLN